MGYSLLGRQRLDAWLAETSEPPEVQLEVRKWFAELLRKPGEFARVEGEGDPAEAFVVWVGKTDVVVTFSFGMSKGPVTIPVVILHRIESLHDVGGSSAQ